MIKYYLIYIVEKCYLIDEKKYSIIIKENLMWEN